MNSKWMTVPEAAEYLRCGERVLREMMANGEVPLTMFAGKALFHPDRLDEWLLSMENSPAEVKPPSEESTNVRPDVPRGRVAELISKLLDPAELLGYPDKFVRSLGSNLKKALDESEYKSLTKQAYAQLSRWCHPRRDSSREQTVLPIAHEISTLLFGKVIDRTK